MAERYSSGSSFAIPKELIYHMLLDSNIIIYAAEPSYDSVRQFIAEK